ncbi:hypothetical protein lerEdw1_002380 [Lerista edwardsae]|nr:hypothetical protein lerEdw1_002382 [Lerista edwardsae]KAJ6650866.1 hypothetical protein lerEdw1_002380 [Lerista edwardsae]
MAARNQCYASCPPTTVTIQPPPFVLTIPGPALYCPSEPLGIQQENPCARGGAMGGGASSFLYEGPFYHELESGLGYCTSLASLYRSRYPLL